MTTAGGNKRFVKTIEPVKIDDLELFPSSRCRACKGKGVLYNRVFERKVPCGCLSVMAEDGRGTKIDLQAMWGVFANQKLVRVG